MAQAQYARWESGGRNPKDETVKKLAEIFDVSFDSLKGIDGGLEEIVDLLRQYKLLDKQKYELEKWIKELFNSIRIMYKWDF